MSVLALLTAPGQWVLDANAGLGQPRPGMGMAVAGVQQTGPAADDAAATTVELPAAPAADDLPDDPPLAELGQALFVLANADRAANGLPPVQWDTQLLAIARTRANAQLVLPRLSHLDAAGDIAFGVLLGRVGARYQLAGENLARLPGPGATAPLRAEEGLMNSPPHRENILQPTYDRLAVGAALEPDGRIVFAQIFRASGENPAQ